MITVHGMAMSGNCYKVELALEQLGRSYQWNEVDAPRGATRTPQFLALNPAGRVPLLQLEDGRLLPESNAILCWLAEGTPLLPGDAWQRAQALRWMFFEQYSHEPYIAVARFIRGWTPADSPRRTELARLHERGHEALAVMERHLRDADWFTGPQYGVADIALFAYTHCAADGGFDLSPYPAIGAWLARVRATPGFVPMRATDHEALARFASDQRAAPTA